MRRSCESKSSPAISFLCLQHAVKTVFCFLPPTERKSCWCCSKRHWGKMTEWTEHEVKLNCLCHWVCVYSNSSVSRCDAKWEKSWRGAVDRHPDLQRPGTSWQRCSWEVLVSYLQLHLSLRWPRLYVTVLMGLELEFGQTVDQILEKKFTGDFRLGLRILGKYQGETLVASMRLSVSVISL